MTGLQVGAGWVAKKAFLKQQLGDASYLLLKQIKHTLDPENLLNPGKISD